MVFQAVFKPIELGFRGGRIPHEVCCGLRRGGGVRLLRLQGGNSIETFQVEFWLGKSLETFGAFKIPYTYIKLKSWQFRHVQRSAKKYAYLASGPRLGQAEMLSKSRKKFLATTYKLFSQSLYRVSHHVSDLCWVDLDFGSSPGWWSTIVAGYCPSRVVEHHKSKSTQTRSET